MKNYLSHHLLVILFLISSNVLAQEQEGTYKVTFNSKGQKISFISGDIAKLSSVKSFNAILEPQHYAMGIKGEADTVYINKKVKELNAKKAGRGDDWEKEWKTTTSHFLPAFVEGYNDYIEKSNIPKIVEIENETSQKSCTMALKLIFLYTYIDSPRIGLYLDIYSNENKNDTIMHLLLNIQWYNNSKKYPGANTGAFFTAGRVLGKYFEKDIFKDK